MPRLQAAFRREEEQNREAFLGINLRLITGQSHDSSKDNRQQRGKVDAEQVFAELAHGYDN